MRVLICILVSFLIVTGCQNPFKAPYNEQQDLEKWIDVIEKQVNVDKWEEAENTQITMKKGWADIRNRVALNASTDDLTELEISMEQLMAYIKEKEKVHVLAELGKLKQLWDGIARF